MMLNLDLDISEDDLLLETNFPMFQIHSRVERHPHTKGSLGQCSLRQDKIQTRQFAYAKLAQAGPC